MGGFIGFTGYAGASAVNTFNDPQTALLKDVRKVNNIWRYLRDGYLGMYWSSFKRQFYMKYDYLPIGFDSEEEFSYRLAGILENCETEYVGRLNSEDLIKNPLVSRILQDDVYRLQSERTKRYDTHNSINDSVEINQRSVLGVNANTSQEIENNAEQSASDAKGERLKQQENMSDYSETQHTLTRDSDSPQDVQTTLMPIGWTGTAGAIGTATKNDHYPKAEALVALPFNSGYVSTIGLVNTAHDTHNTEGEESKETSLNQARSSAIAARETAALDSTVSRSNQQGGMRQQNQGYYDNSAATILAHDDEESRELVGLEGRTVGSVWAEWQELQKYKNAIGDLVSECRRCFLLTC